MHRPIALLAIVACISGCGGAGDRSETARQIETVAGPVTATTTTVDHFPQTIVPVTGAQLEYLRSLTDESQGFLRAYTAPGTEPSLLGYDLAFEAWLKSRSRAHAAEQVTEILGGVLGNRCVDELNMQWVEVTDHHGSDYAVRHRESQAMGFPYSSVRKRINANEYGFLVGIYATLKDTLKDTLERAAVQPRVP